MFRFFTCVLIALFFVFVVLLLAPPARAQHAYCDCCGRLYRVPGAKWIGASRVYGGLCSDCRGICLGCRGEAEYVRGLYNALQDLRRSDRLNALESFVLNQVVNRMEQRWSDLRSTCLKAGGRDIGTISPRTRKPLPPLGLNTAGAKDRLSQDAKTIENDVADLILEVDQNATTAKDPALHNALVSAIKETADLVGFQSQLASESTNKIGSVIAPRVEPLPKADANPTAAGLLQRAAIAQKNSNSYARAYLASREQFLAARKTSNKNAMHEHVRAMGKFAHSAEHEARLAALSFREYEALRLKRIEAEGNKWPDQLKRCQDKIRKGWPSPFSNSLDAANISAQQREAIRRALLAWTPQSLDKALAERKTRIGFDAAFKAALAKNKLEASWPEPRHQFALDTMKLDAHVLHAELIGRKPNAPKSVSVGPGQPHDAKKTVKPLTLPNWGEFINPSGKCQGKVEKGRLTIVVPGGQHNLNPTSAYNNVLGPRALQQVEGDFDLTVKVLAFPKPKPKTASGKDGHSYVAAGLLVWQDQKTFLRAFRAANGDRGDVFVHVENFRNSRPAYSRFFIRNVKERIIPDEAIYLRVQRRGSQLTVFRSFDGKSFSPFAAVTDRQMPKQLRIGVGAVNATRAPFSPQFDGLSLQRRKSN